MEEPPFPGSQLGAVSSIFLEEITSQLKYKIWTWFSQACRGQRGEAWEEFKAGWQDEECKSPESRAWCVHGNLSFHCLHQRSASGLALSRASVNVCWMEMRDRTLLFTSGIHLWHLFHLFLLVSWHCQWPWEARFICLFRIVTAVHPRLLWIGWFCQATVKFLTHSCDHRSHSYEAVSWHHWCL